MTTESMPAFIEEANKLYVTDPAGAVALLYEGTRKLKEHVPQKERPERKEPQFRSERDRQLMLLESAHGLMEYLREDAEEGILPDPLSWELKIGVAKDIVWMTGYNGH